MDWPTDEQIAEQQGLSVLPLTKKKVQSPTLTTTVQPGQGTVLPQAIGTYRQRAADMYQQATDLYNSDPDTSALQEYARKRGEQGQSAMMNALAAQFAGESFQPIQQQFLKRAQGADEAVKLGTGLLTPDGQYLKDPFAAQDKRAELLLNQAKAYEQMATTAETARERLAAQQAQNEIMRQLQLMGLDLRKQGIDIQRQGLELRANKPEDHSKDWRAEDKLRNDFDNLTKDLREELAATGKITSIVSATPPGGKPDALTQQSLVILLNKFLDPGSVVREGEFDRVVKAQGLEGQAKNLADRILRGMPLDANTIGQINGLAQLYQKAATTKIQAIANDYIDIANKRKLDAGSVISNPAFRSGSKAPNPSGSGALSAEEQQELDALRKKHGRQ